MDKDFLKFMSFVAFMEAKKEAERDCSAEAAEWQDTIPTIRRKPDPATEALLLSRIRMPEKPENKMGSAERALMGIRIIGLFDAAFPSDTRASSKTTTTYSPTVTQYHRRD